VFNRVRDWLVHEFPAALAECVRKQQEAWRLALVPELEIVWQSVGLLKRLSLDSEALHKDFVDFL
jgi:hypothetical protein